MSQGNDLFAEMFLSNTPTKRANSGSTNAGKQRLSEGPAAGPEFLRISQLPTRDWQKDYDVPQLIREYTAELRDPRVPAPADKSELLPMQAAALHDLRVYKRLYVVANMGTGKLGLAALAPTVAGFTRKNTLYVVPSALKEKTIREIQEWHRAGWRVCLPDNIISCDELASRTKKNLLYDLAPHCIVIDESHVFGNPDSGRSTRLDRYVDDARPLVIPMTGTPGDSTLNTVRHLLIWSLGEQSCPLPTDANEWWLWKAALDDSSFDPAKKRKRERPPPGVLADWVPDGVEVSLETVRNAVGLRIESTPGVFYYRTDDAPGSLRMVSWQFTNHPPTLAQEFAAARGGADELSDGRVIDVPVDDKVLFQTLGLGFVRIIDPPPPMEWRAARKAWNSYAREVLRDESLGFDTPGEIVLAIERGDLIDTSGSYETWKAIYPTFEVHKHVVWLTDAVAEAVCERVRDRPEGEPVLVWVPYPALGRKLSKLLGVPFFHSKGFSADGEYVERYDPRGGPCVLSVNANATGRNLQGRYSRNIVVGDISKADRLQQLIARTHRRGQTATETHVEFFVASIETALSLHKARERAKLDRDLGRAKQSKLLDGDWLVPDVASFWDNSSPIWSKKR